MDVATDRYVDARNNMVDGQLRPNKVGDRRILAAMRRLPRELFVPPAHQALAYADVEVPLGDGRFLLEPMVLARLIQAAELPDGGSVLVLGAGYAAAVWAACGAKVAALEQDATRADAMQTLLAGSPVSIVRGPFALGWAAGAPYDCIFVDGAVARLPPLAAQLRADPPGRLCAVLIATGRNGRAVLAERAELGLSSRPLFDCAATPMPQFEQPDGFRF